MIEIQNREAAKESIRKGDCPFCGRSGFRKVTQHIWWGHKILSRDLRLMLGFTFTESLSQEFSEQMRAIGLERNPDFGRKFHPRSREISPAAHELNTRKITGFIATASPERRSEMARKAADRRWHSPDGARRRRA